MTNFDKDILDMIESEFTSLLNKIETYSKEITIKYNINNNGDRDLAFLNDLNTVIKLCNTIQYVYINNNNQIHPTYALEKLNMAKSIIDNIILYYEAKVDKTLD